MAETIGALSVDLRLLSAKFEQGVGTVNKKLDGMSKQAQSVNKVFGSLLAVGGGAAFFLYALDWCTEYREANTEIIWLLPVAGFLIGALYFYFGKSVVKGNNQLIEEYHYPEKTIPFEVTFFLLLKKLVAPL